MVERIWTAVLLLASRIKPTAGFQRSDIRWYSGSAAGDECTNWLWLSPVSNFPGGPALNHTHESSRDLWEMLVGCDVWVQTR